MDVIKLICGQYQFLVSISGCHCVELGMDWGLFVAYKSEDVLLCYLFLTEKYTITSRSWYVVCSCLSIVIIISHSVPIMVFHFTEKKHMHDPDDDSGMGPSMKSDGKSTTFSEVYYCLLECIFEA